MGMYGDVTRAAALAAVLVLVAGASLAAYQEHAVDYDRNLVFAAGADVGQPYEPPRKQTEAGVAPEDVACRDGHVLAIRTAGHVPICVTPGTAESLSERGVVARIIGYTEAYVPRQDASGTQDAGEQPATGGVAAGGSDELGATGNNNNSSSSDVDTDDKNANGDLGPDAGANDTATVTQQYGTMHRGDVSAVPASTMSIVNFYVTDDDLNVSPGAPDIIPTEGLLLFAINGIPIEGPPTMTETGPSTGQFYVRLELPPTIDGRPLNQDDVVSVTYLDQTDRSGERHTSTKSFALSSTYAQMHAEGSGGKRIGHEFILSIYEPDANTDSREENLIPLNRFEFKSEGNIRATLDHGAFDANRSHMVETGPNTGVFEVTIKIPRQIDGEVIHIGDWYEIIYHDYSTPSGTSEEIVLRGKIGLQG